MPACCSKSPMFTVRYSALKGRPASSRRTSAGRVTAACIPNRRRPEWCPVARKAACSAQCPLCGENPAITQLIDYDMFCGITPEPETTAHNPDEVTVHDMQKALADP